MTRRILCALCLVCAVSLAACSSSGSKSKKSSSSTSVTSITGKTERVEPTHTAVGVYPLAFQAAHAKKSAVLVLFTGGVKPCFVLDHYSVSETSKTVTIELFAGSEPGAADKVCPQLAKFYYVFIPLASPLGSRSVVDGAVQSGASGGD